MHFVVITMLSHEKMCVFLLQYLSLDLKVSTPEVEITYGHWSFSVHFIRMVDHIYAWSVGMTERKVFVARLIPPPPT